MTVSIPVSADAAAVVAAFRQIEEAIKRVQGSAKSLKDVDLSHPELKALAGDLQKVEQQLRDVERLGRGTTATTMRQINRTLYNGASSSPSGVLGLLDYVQATERAFPDPQGRARHLSTIGRHILQGTQFAPPAPPVPPVSTAPPPPPSAPTPMGMTSSQPSGGGGAGIMGGVAGFTKMALPWVLAGAGVKGVTDTIMTALSQAQQESGQNDTLYRTVRDTSASFDELRASVRQFGTGLQLTYDQAQRLSLTWEKLTNADAAGALNGMRLSAAVARGYGVDPGAMTQTLGQADYLRQDPRRFAMLIGDAVRDGQMHGQVEQVMQALLSWTERATRLAPGTGANDVAKFADLFAAMNASNVPGLKGQAGTALIGQVDSAIRSGGGAGDASLAFMYRAFGRSGITDPYQVRMLMQSGMFASPHSALGQKGDQTVYEMLRGELDREYGDKYSLRKADAFSNLTGLSMPQASGLMQMRLGQLHSTQDYLDRNNINLGTVNPTALPEIAQVIGPNADLDGWRRRLLGTTGADALSGNERDILQGAHGDDALRLALVKVMASHGMQTTEGSRMAQSQSDLSNALTAAGTGLIPVVTDLKTAAADLARVVAEFTQKLGQGYDSVVHGRYMPGGKLPGLAGDVAAQVRASAAANGLDANHMMRLFQQEHGGYNNVSPAGAFGPAQLMPDTARGEGVATSPNDPHYSWQANVGAGMSYYAKLLKMFNGNYAAADAAYNAGPNNPGVKYFAQTGDPSRLPAETRKYIEAIGTAQPGVMVGTQTPTPPAATAGQKVSMDMTHRFAPLQVDVNVGGQSSSQYLPVTSVGQPMPVGLA